MTLTWEGPHSGRTIEDLSELAEGIVPEGVCLRCNGSRIIWAMPDNAPCPQCSPEDSVPYSAAFPDSEPEDAQAMADALQAERDRGNG